MIKFIFLKSDQGFIENLVNGWQGSLQPEAGLFLDTLTNEEGGFELNNLVFADSTRFVLQARSFKEEENVRIRLEKFHYKGVNYH